MPQMTSTTSTPKQISSAKQDALTMGLVGLAHGTSHFFHLLLPPLFPFLALDFGLTYTELGLLVTVFFVVSGVGQAASGFLVDRTGARPVLFAALACFALAALATAVAPGYLGLMCAAALAGLGNAPFHPADFTILNQRVSSARLGHAFSVHGIAGNLGWASAPLFLTGITAATGSWRIAAACAFVVAVVVWLVLWFHRDSIDDRPAQADTGSHPSQAASQPNVAEHPLAFLRLPAVYLCFAFFFWSTCALSAIQGFASPALFMMYALPLSVGAWMVSGYMVSSALGMVVGGFLVSKLDRANKLITPGLLASALLLFMVASVNMPGWLAACVTAMAGLGAGLAGPSRDMLVKQAAPVGATGRVYGTVYSGLDLGFALAAPVFGYLLDRGMDRSVFYGSALALTLGVVSAALVTRASRPRPGKTARA